MERIGPYRVGRTLGSGAMGVVLEAVDEGLQRVVALKVIAPHLAADPAFRERFVREARALAALDSPHVVRVYAHGEDDGRLWLATQLLPDGDLGALLEARGRLPVREALDVVAQVASGLADAHAAGLVHRDIKPANVLLRRGPAGITAYLSDLGISRRLGADDPPSDPPTGTPAYMAPELRAGGRADVASDVYAVGCLLWATLTGLPPFEGEVPRGSGVDRVLDRALATRSEDRHPSAAALRDDLRATIARSDDPPARRGRAVAGVAAAALLLAAAAGGAWLLGRGEGDGAEEERAGRTDRQAAVAHLAQGFRSVEGMSRPQAECTAEAWVDEAGLDLLEEAGLLDEEMRYVDPPARSLRPAIVTSLRRAVLACVEEG